VIYQGYIGYWNYALDIQEEEEIIEDLLVVCEFKDVFSEELLGLAPQREIDFEIELIPSAQPISKAHYRLAHRSLEN